ncbi:MAG: hypothetical protein H6741_14980 [Alphaproteobacteria bacterium]|nr:hypothetical protein [Alphaproteobacteria bacterium]
MSIYEDRRLEDLDARLGHPRHCLHAAELVIPHPDGGLLELRAPLPEDMQAALAGADTRVALTVTS